MEYKEEQYIILSMELIQLGAIYIPTTSSNISWGSIENTATTLKPRRKENTEQQQTTTTTEHTPTV